MNIRYLEQELYYALITYNKNCKGYFKNGKNESKKNGHYIVSYTAPKGESLIFGVDDILANNSEIGKSISPVEWVKIILMNGLCVVLRKIFGVKNAMIHAE